MDDVDEFTMRMFRLELEIDPDGSELEWWTAHLEDVTTDMATDSEIRREPVAIARFVRVHGLVWGYQSIVMQLDAESQALYEVGERLFEEHDEDSFEDFREFRSTLIVIDTFTTEDIDAGAELAKSIGRVMDDSIVVLAPDLSPWEDPTGRVVDDQVRLRAAARAWDRAGFRPNKLETLLILRDAETLTQ